MSDNIERLGSSLIQHGPDNNRIYLMKLDSDDSVHGIIEKLDKLAAQKGYTKIFAKVPEGYTSVFVSAGYLREGIIPYFYNGNAAAVFMGKFIDPMRGITPRRDEIEKIIAQSQFKSGSKLRPMPAGYTLRPATEEDAAELAAVYRNIFASYPFPIHDPAFLVETMRSHVCYFVAEKEGRIVAAASGEMDRDNRNAEMTDFATLPGHLGNGLSAHLLRHMEPEMAKRGISTLYTIARAISPGMNITFAKCGYAFGGTLINNTQISGSIECMNLWHKTA
jgi:putative beta-lysine N-acetyltransferase